MIQKIKAEIERLIQKEDLYLSADNINNDERRRLIEKYKDILSFIESLEQELIASDEETQWRGYKVGYNQALYDIKGKVDKIYDDTSIGLNEYDSGLYNGITETCCKLRGFIKSHIDESESLPRNNIEQEPPQGLEEAAKEFSVEQNYPVHAYCGFKAGAQWQKEKYLSNIYIDAIWGELVCRGVERLSRADVEDFVERLKEGKYDKRTD